MSGRHILIVEGDDSVAQEIAGWLSGMVDEVRVVHGGEEAAGEALAGVDAILLRVELPDGSGYSVCSRLKKAPATSSIPLLLYSSEAAPEILEQHRSLDHRADGYMTWPFGEIALLDQVHQLLGEDVEITEMETAFPAEALEVVEELVIDDEFDAEDELGYLLVDDEPFELEMPEDEEVGEAFDRALAAGEAKAEEPEMDAIGLAEADIVEIEEEAAEAVAEATPEELIPPPPPAEAAATDSGASNTVLSDLQGVFSKVGDLEAERELLLEEVTRLEGRATDTEKTNQELEQVLEEATQVAEEIRAEADVSKAAADEAGDGLEAAEAAVASANERIGEFQGSLDELRGELSQARETLRDERTSAEEQLTKLAEHHALAIRGLEDRLATLEAEREEALDQLREADSTVKERSRQNQVATERMASLAEEREALSGALDTARTELRTTSTTLLDLGDRIAALEAQVRDSDQSADAAREQGDGLRAELAEAKAKIEEQAAALAMAEAEQISLQSEAETALRTASEIEVDLEQMELLRQDVDGARTEIREAQEASTGLQASLDEARADAESLAAELENNREAHAEAVSAEAQLQAEVQTYRDDEIDRQAGVALAEQEVEKLAAEVTAAKESEADALVALETAREELRIAKEDIERAANVSVESQLASQQTLIAAQEAAEQSRQEEEAQRMEERLADSEVSRQDIAAARADLELERTELAALQDHVEGLNEQLAEARLLDAEIELEAVSRVDAAEQERDALRQAAKRSAKTLEQAEDIAGELGELRAAHTELEARAAKSEERLLRAFQRVKTDERVKEKVARAVRIALSLLDDPTAAGATKQPTKPPPAPDKDAEG